MTSAGIMPRFVVVCVLLAACSFEADYRGGNYTCHDGMCPSGLVCENARCVERSSADAHDPALTCGDPGLLGSSATGSTAGRTSRMSAMCSGVVMNGPDAVYRVDAAAGDVLHVSVSGSFAVNAYVLASCTPAPALPACLTNMAASDGSPIAVTASTAGAYFIVVDAALAAAAGSYTVSL